jgi:Ser/Thr protein kinase RdoA (MazF antagonist)
MLPDHVLEAFNLNGPVQPLAGGTVQVYRVGDIVVKPIKPGSLENQHSLVLIPWLAESFADIPEDGFRLTRQVRTCDGRWLTADHWSAWQILDGNSPVKEDIPQVITAIRAMHRAVSQVPKHPLLDQNDLAWGVAHKYCWGEPPPWIHPELENHVNALYDKLKPLPRMERQLIHGDLSPDNILIAPGKPPGFIDFTPFWASADFAIAIFANFIGPRQDDAAALPYFSDIPHFDQLLLRAAIRMLLVVSELCGVDDWRTERCAAEIVLDYML